MENFQEIDMGMEFKWFPPHTTTPPPPTTPTDRPPPPPPPCKKEKESDITATFCKDKCAELKITKLRRPQNVSCEREFSSLQGKVSFTLQPSSAVFLLCKRDFSPPLSARSHDTGYYALAKSAKQRAFQKEWLRE
jgi:hypothetical protein